MKKLVFVMLAALTIVSCQKKETETTPQFQDVSFKAIQITPDGGLKSTADWECKDIIPTHAWVVINNENYYPELFVVDGDLFTQALKLPVLENNGEYCISAFVLYLEGNNTTGFQTMPEGDEIVFGTPQPGSEYETYINVDYRFQYCFTIDAFAKAEIPVEVLCYQNADYTEFGFNWFAITEIVIREQCFFGDFCITNPADYNSSNYGLQSTWPAEVVSFIDAPAIVSLNVYKNTQSGWVEVANSPFTNNTLDAAYGVGSPVCVQYPDNLSVDGEEFKVVLNILIQQGTNFEMVEFHTWLFNDDQMIVAAPPASDGVVDFVLGTCNLSETDLQLTLPVAPVIGGEMEGGILAYIFQPGDPGYVENEVHGLIASSADLSTNIIWGTVYGSPLGLPQNLGDGYGNTTTIITVTGNPGGSTYAASLCRNHNGGGFTDWSLPSVAELQKLYNNRVAIGGFSTDVYWASRYFDGGFSYLAQTLDFNSGSIGGQPYDQTFWGASVRAVRYF